ncbi:hypothetical protein RHMOL_Rhmol08G0209300 [Rhododendron molle]|uniref:Uncharacterized protein n=1 Tax=Rhododendron molle TaxID=49168 RepID=A0ACC0MS11_RHOML|nr:hypothetical protein RHMOL_Rhmol08G0209300 [Rhododendron molle]
MHSQYLLPWDMFIPMGRTIRPSSPKSDRPSEEPRREKEEAEEDHRPHPPPPPATPTTTPGDSHQPHPPRSATTTSLTLHFRRPPVAVKISWAQQRYHHRRRYPTTKYGFPIYSAKAVRFRMQHPRSPIGIGSDSGECDILRSIPCHPKYNGIFFSSSFILSAYLLMSKSALFLPPKNLLFVPLSFSVYWSHHFIAHASNASYQHRLQMGGVSIVENMLTDGWSKHQRSNSCGIAGGHGMLEDGKRRRFPQLKQSSKDAESFRGKEE